MLKGLVVKSIIKDILDINDDAEGFIYFFDGVDFNGELFVGGHDERGVSGSDECGVIILSITFQFYQKRADTTRLFSLFS